MLEEKENLNSNMIAILNRLIELTPFDTVEYDTELDFQTILKVYNVRFEEYFDSLGEKIAAFVRMMALLFHKRILFFVNLKTFLSAEEIAQVVKLAGYYHISVILLESSCENGLENEKCYIIDKDECLIY